MTIDGWSFDYKNELKNDVMKFYLTDKLGRIITIEINVMEELFIMNVFAADGEELFYKTFGYWFPYQL